MKRKILSLKAFTTLAIMTFMGIALPVAASDYFPIDIWEEMESWESKDGAVYILTNQGIDQLKSKNFHNLDVVHASFPFDVRDALDDLGGTDLHHIKAFSESNGTSAGKTMNPYWLPEEYRSP